MCEGTALVPHRLRRVVGCRFVAAADHWAFQETLINGREFQARVSSQQAFDRGAELGFAATGSFKERAPFLRR